MKRNIFQKVGHKVWFGWNVIKFYKNWFTGFLDYSGLIKEKYILYRLRNGSEYVARPGTNDFGIINEIYIVKEYDPLMKYIKKDSVIIDIGAQIGVFTVLVAKKARKGKVFSFEPFEDNYKMLEKNIKLNSLSNVKIFKKAIAKRAGTRELIISEENTGGHSFYESMGRKVNVETISLKEVFDKNKIKLCDFLKLDCEGAEYEIILNTPKSYLDKINSITMEYHNNDNVKKLETFLKKNSFSVKIFDEGDKEGMLYAWRNN